MLMVTTSMGMLYGILSHTTNLRPAVALDGILVVGSSGLQQRLIGTTTSGDNSDLGTDVGWDGLLTSGRKSKLGGSLLIVVGDNNGVGTGATGESTTVSGFGFDVANNGSLGNRSQGQDVTAGKAGLLTAVDELSAVHTFRTQEQFIVTLVSVLVDKLHTADWGTSTGVVHNFLDGTSEVTLLLSIIKRSKLDRSLSGAGVRLEDRRLTLSLCLNNLTHIA